MCWRGARGGSRGGRACAGDGSLEAGRYETYLPFSLLSETRRLRDVLEAKGYRVTYSEFVGGHNEVCWRGSFANALMALTAGRRP